jgi:nitroimidazol reductase NimA-like FMN-containing flavoprotein (pyridoxamine 5'-phosphate oxidase superfamily)
MRDEAEVKTREVSDEIAEVKGMAAAKGAASSAGAPHPLSNRKSPAPGPNAHYRRFLQALSPTECFDLLEPGGIGRVGMATGEGVIILPVNYAVKGQAIIYRTAPDTLLALHVNTQVSFEVDQCDGTLHEGWSVLVQGHAHEVTDEHQVKQIEDTTHLKPWAPGARDVYVRLAPTEISGRRIQPS